jgi:hypothetical protein
MFQQDTPLKQQDCFLNPDFAFRQGNSIQVHKARSFQETPNSLPERR